MDISKAGEWIRQAQIKPSCCLILSDVPIDVKDETIADVLNTVKLFGRTKIHGKRGDPTGTKLFLLLETSNDIVPGKMVSDPSVGDAVFRKSCCPCCSRKESHWRM